MITYNSNPKKILRLLRKGKPLSKMKIGRTLGINCSSIFDASEKLKFEGLIMDAKPESRREKPLKITNKGLFFLKHLDVIDKMLPLNN